MVEGKWLVPLTKYTGRIFRSGWIPSHDETHSLRAWSFAKELYLQLEKKKFIADPSTLEKILIALFFHDLGMIKDPGPSHGKLSREMCVDYFEKNKFKKPDGFELILDAIENHDDKSYRALLFQNPDRLSVLDALSVSDDLDAFGLVGVYRYWEAYKLRGIPENLIPEKVIQNLDSRFNHFRDFFSFLIPFFEHHQNRYLKTRQFYSDLLNAFSNPQNLSAFPFRVIKIFNEKILENHIYPSKLLLSLEEKADVKEARFLTDFGNEFSGI